MTKLLAWFIVTVAGVSFVGAIIGLVIAWYQHDGWRGALLVVATFVAVAAAILLPIWAVTELGWAR